MKGAAQSVSRRVPDKGTPAGQLLDNHLRFPVGLERALLRHFCRTGYTPLHTPPAHETITSETVPNWAVRQKCRMV